MDTPPDHRQQKAGRISSQVRTIRVEEAQHKQGIMKRRRGEQAGYLKRKKGRMERGEAK
jgi:hypothetical protein